MTQIEKELLLKDLCARLPYGLKYNFSGYDGCDYTMSKVGLNTVDDNFPIEDIKPYLFPLSNMTKEEKKECLKITFVEATDWLNVHHFDYRGLIEKGLAIDATGLNIY